MRRIVLAILLGTIAAMIGCSAMEEHAGWTSTPHGPEPSIPPNVEAIPVEVQLDRALTLIADRQYDDAIDILTEVTDGLEPDDRTTMAEAYLWLGFCYERKGDPVCAHQYYDQVRMKWPDTLAAATARDLMRHP